MKPILPTDWTGKYFPVISMISHFNKPKNSQHLSTCGVYIWCLIWPNDNPQSSSSVPDWSWWLQYLISDQERTMGEITLVSFSILHEMVKRLTLPPLLELGVTVLWLFCSLQGKKKKNLPSFFFRKRGDVESLVSLVTPCWPAASTACRRFKGFRLARSGQPEKGERQYIQAGQRSRK